MFTRSQSKISKTIARSRNLTQATVTLRISSNLMQQMRCTIEKASYYSVVISKSIDCVLVDRNLGSKIAKVNLIFPDDCYFACDTSSILCILQIANSSSDKCLQFSRLTLTQKMTILIDRFDDKNIQAALFFCNDTDELSITLKRIDDDKLLWRLSFELIANLFFKERLWHTLLTKLMCSARRFKIWNSENIFVLSNQ